MEVFTPDKAFLSLADLIQSELLEKRPLGVSLFSRSFEYTRLVGLCAHFTGIGPDQKTQLCITYIKPNDPRATDALSCLIDRGKEKIFIAHYLKHIGEDSSFMSNVSHQPPEQFLVAAITKLGALNKFPELLLPLAGGAMVAIPFDYGNAR